MGLLSDEPGTPLQYFLMKNAWRKYAGDIGEEKGIFPLMAKIWSGQKHATASTSRLHGPASDHRHEGADFLKGYTPRNEQEFFEPCTGQRPAQNAAGPDTPASARTSPTHSFLGGLTTPCLLC